MATRSTRAEMLSAWAAGVGKGRGDAVLDFDRSAAQLRDLLRTGLLKMTDLRDDPEWFFEAHRIIANNGDNLGQGFWTRFTVQYNLFAGTILAVGNEAQVRSLADMQAAADLGCFGLTEKFAGVSSGMIVETIAEFDSAAKEFVLKSPNEGAYKNWISQGFVADKSVVIADLHLDGKVYGPHSFLIDFRTGKGDARELVKGVRLADMGRKSVCNDLDNAWIAFDGVRIPKSAMLSRHASIDESGRYVQHLKGLGTMEMIGQRLFTGRVAVAEAALCFGRILFARTQAYTDRKLCWAPNGMRPPLSFLPQLGNLYKEAEEAFGYAERYASECEAQLCQCLRGNRIPAAKLQEAIAVAKIRSVETVIQLCFRLKQTVGSYALMAGSGFEQLDTMQIAKFAEGESFVLMQKIARDRVKKASVVGSLGDEDALCTELREARGQEWMNKSEKVYLLAEQVMDRTMVETMGTPPPRGIGRPFAKL